MPEYTHLVRAIINQMRTITGPVAVTQANKVSGLSTNGKTIIHGNPQRVLNELLNKYALIMGPVAITIAKKGAAPILEKNPKLKVPNELR